jgi:hypothetical protein
MEYLFISRKSHDILSLVYFTMNLATIINTINAVVCMNVSGCTPNNGMTILSAHHAAVIDRITNNNTAINCEIRSIIVFSG